MDFLRQARVGQKSGQALPNIAAPIQESGFQVKPFSFKSDASLRSLNVRVTCNFVTQGGNL